MDQGSIPCSSTTRYLMKTNCSNCAEYASEFCSLCAKESPSDGADFGFDMLSMRKPGASEQATDNRKKHNKCK